MTESRLRNTADHELANKRLVTTHRSGERHSLDVRRKNSDMRQIATFLIVMLSVAGCLRTAGVSLSRDSDKNRDALASLIPKGTQSADAERLMRENGFDWQLHRNETVRLTKGSQTIGKTEPMTFALCSRQSDDTIWQAIIVLNDQDQVEEIDISSDEKR